MASLAVHLLVKALLSSKVCGRSAWRNMNWVMGSTCDPLVWAAYHVTSMALVWLRWTPSSHGIPFSLRCNFQTQNSNKGQNDLVKIRWSRSWVMLSSIFLDSASTEEGRCSQTIQKWIKPLLLTSPAPELSQCFLSLCQRSSNGQSDSKIKARTARSYFPACRVWF